MKRLCVVGVMMLTGCNYLDERRAKEIASQDLFDPASAQYRRVQTIGSGSRKCVSGEINAKNQFGAYIGFRRFIVKLDGATYAVDQGQDRSWDQLRYENIKIGCD